jgi:hypothetical protein
MINLQVDAKEGEDAVGWLFKRGGAARMVWQKRWFVLKGGRLFYYKAPNDDVPRGEIRLHSCSVRELRENQFQITHSEYIKRVLCGESEQHTQLWVDTLEKAIRTSAAEGSYDGWLHKKGSDRHSWKRRWMVLDGAQQRLYYYADPTDATEKGTVNLAGCEVAQVPSKQKEFRFHIVQPDGTSARQFYADTVGDGKQWADALKKVSTKDVVGDVRKQLADNNEQSSKEGLLKLGGVGSPLHNGGGGGDGGVLMVDEPQKRNTAERHTGSLLYKSHGLRNNWKPRHFVLTDDELFHYLTPDDQTPKDVVNMHGARIEVMQGGKYAHHISVHAMDGNVLELRPDVEQAGGSESEQELMDEWRNNMQAVILESAMEDGLDDVPELNPLRLV